MVSMRADQEVDLNALGVGVNGGVTTAQFDGRLTWASSNPEFVEVSNEANTLAALAVARGVGTAEVTVTGSDGAGRQFSATVTVEVTALPLEVTDHLEIVPGEPRDQNLPF